MKTKFTFNVFFKHRIKINVDKIAYNATMKNVNNAKQVILAIRQVVSSAIVGVTLAKNLINVRNAKQDCS